MNKTFQIQQLVNARKLSSTEDYLSFENALQELQGNICINDIYQMSKVFCDDTGDEEVMFGLVHLIETLVGEEYLKCIALCSPDMIEAHDWAMTLNKRIINSPLYFEQYIRVIKGLETDNKMKILELLNDLKNDNPKRFSEKVDIIIKQASL